MRRSLLAGMTAVSLFAGVAASTDNPAAPGFDVEGSDARAVEIADRTMTAMGGRASWDAAQCLGWTIFGRTHLWNKWTGDYRLEEDTLVVIMNVNTGEGRAWRGDAEVTDAAKKTDALSRARSIWINDSYWFIMPYKLKDTGVTLTYLGERATKDDRVTDVLGLTFGNVGDTPENRYEVFVDRESGLVTQWSFFKTAADTEPRFTLPWTGWTVFGGIKLATGRGRTDVTNIRVSAADERAAFSAPE